MTSRCPHQGPLGNPPRALFVLRLFAWCSAFLLSPSPELIWGGEEVRERPLESVTVSPPTPLPIVGERLSFHGRWFGIPVGYGWIEVKGVVDLEGQPAYHIEAQGHSNDVLSTFYPIHDEIHSYVDVNTLRPIRFEKHQREGHYRADEVVTFDYTRSIATYRSLLNQSVKEIALPPDVLDLIGALYWFRAQPIGSETAMRLNLYTDEKIYHTEIQIKRPILLELLKRGTFSCLVVEPKASFKGLLVKRGRLWAYLTADEHRLPLLIKITTPWGPMSAVIDETSLPPTLQMRESDAGRRPAGP